MQASLEQRQRLHQLFFPNGVVFDGKKFVRTGVSTPAFKYLTSVEPAENHMASPIPGSWNQIISWLRQVDGVRHAAGALAARSPNPYSSNMSPLRARVEKGHIILNEPTTLPEGTVIDLVADDEGDDLTDEQRRVLHAALSASWTAAEAGQLRPASEILDELRRRR